MVNIWGGQTSVDKGWVSFGLSLGDGGGGSWDSGADNWEGIVQGVGQGQGVVDNWGVGHSLDNWGVDSSVVDKRGVSNSLDSSLDNWDIVDAGDGDLGVDEAAQQGRAGNIAGHWVVDSAVGVEKSGVSLGLRLSICGSLSVVSVWVSSISVSVSTIVSTIWPGISIISIEGISISLWFSISGSLS